MSLLEPITAFYIVINIIAVVPIYLTIMDEYEEITNAGLFREPLYSFYCFLKDDGEINAIGIIVALLVSAVLIFPAILIFQITHIAWKVVYGIIYGFWRIFRKR